MNMRRFKARLQLSARLVLVALACLAGIAAGPVPVRAAELLMYQEDGLSLIHI